MPYCVNCGVELDSGCPSCPLCDTEVIIPSKNKIRENPQTVSSYSSNFEIPKSTSKKYASFVLSIMMLIPNVVFVILDIFFWEQDIAKFIVAVSAVLWIWFILPLIWKKPQLLAMLALDMLSLSLCTYLFMDLTAKDAWFTKLAMPIIISAWALAALFILWLKKKRSSTAIVIAAIIAANVMSYVIEICTVLLMQGKLQMYISLASTAGLIPIVIFLLALNRSRRLTAWVKRKFFV